MIIRKLVYIVAQKIFLFHAFFLLLIFILEDGFCGPTITTEQKGKKSENANLLHYKANQEELR